MHLKPARLALLTLSVSLALAACKPTDNAAPTTGAPQSGSAAPAEAGPRNSAEISGAGASFIYPLVSQWSADYNTATGAKVNYQSIGSGGGIAQIKAGTVDFGSSDKPLSSEELAQAGLGQFPSAIGGVVPVINVEGLQPGQLKLTGGLLADIFLGKITTWNDAAIAAINPGVALPAGKISLVHRSDGSGTTFNFSNYLSKVSPEWKRKVGEGTSVQWLGGVGGKGNEGVASYVQQIKGGIGYVELAYALQNSMPYASLQNAAGNFVQPNAETFAAAAASADWANARDFNLVITNAPG
ncbi:MAG: phosphate ABC transporter substrate-binding protein PstS, partial [Pseudoxanthomonas sp.]